MTVQGLAEYLQRVGGYHGWSHREADEEYMRRIRVAMRVERGIE